ncbi:probable E3 ubiquitin-protein ligase ARI2 isoform X1 [Elaeis guineensis]|uniref:RBR-type E3 ubiquitin transferase n=1 Tax=Elaeis guineensis var. tenera TaxID=51953 RepID=A0A6I9SEL0_ELAGV|nr:probable E3 ubiquitin-protein ligase ARI2 isoform X1 [Elaeis guineensis]
MADDDYYPSSGDADDDYIDEDVFIEEAADRPHDAVSWSISSVITSESLLAAQKEDLRKVMDVLAIKEQHARTLLIYYRWNVERVYELLERKGREQLCCDAGVSITENKGLDLLKSSSPITCGICFEDVAPSKATAMDCGHCYCNDCWTQHFIIQINDGKSRCIRCMASKCNAICDEAVVRSLVRERHPDTADRFDRFLLESYIEDNNMVKWCPSKPHCGNAIRVEGDIYCEVECTCGLQFCFNCLLESHSPCSCLMWDLWVKKCNNESENVNWITAHTKHCPKCHKPVEKNGGCNLVRCVCGQYFCYKCGGATGRDHTWSSIGGHSCNRFKEEERSNVETERRKLHRYMHYYNRYKAHTDSFKQESNLMKTIQERISLSENKESGIKDYSWVSNGLHRLFRSRRVLSYTYPFAFYMFGDELFKDEMTPGERQIRQNLFEDQQQQLESNVEKLSLFLEKEFQHLTDEEIIGTRMQVINLSRIVDNSCKEMYQCIENDLLYPLKHSVHHIAPYKSRGLERASELSECWNSDESLRNLKTDNGGNSLQQNSTINGTGATGLGRHSVFQLHASSSAVEGVCSSRKRARKDDPGGVTLFDLNMPAI